MKRPKPLWIVAGSLIGLGVVLVAGLIAIDLFSHEADPQEQIGQRWLKAPGAETAYAGNEACRACHPREFTAHAQTPHARTVRQVFSPEDRPEFHSPQAVTDPAHGVTYSVHARDGQDWLTAWSGGRRSDVPVR